MTQIPGHIFRQWKEYFEWFFESGDELRFARLKAFVGNLALGFGLKRYSGQMYVPDDFLPRDEPEEKSFDSADPHGENWRGFQSFLGGLVGKQG